MTTNRKRLTPGSLIYQFTSSIESYVLSGEEVPSLLRMEDDLRQYAHPGDKLQYSISVREIENEPEVKNIAIKHRKCRFPEENYLTVQKYYSYMGCIVEEKKKAHYKMCNCTHHLMPNPSKYILFKYILIFLDFFYP